MTSPTSSRPTTSNETTTSPQILLNDTGLAAQLTSWRRAAGYDASFAAHCARYGFKYHEESAAILGSTGSGMGRPMHLRV